ncbi:MAG: hypothetical protein K1X94_06280 [Sandaracinaceae bacterium]|nr:hypothetical protein [Sandaracinaceae bacterium]
MRISRRASSAFLVGAFVSGCAAPTEILVIVDTDLDEADTLVVEANVAGGVSQRSSASLSEQAAPRTLVLEHRGGPLGPVRVQTAALHGTTELLTVERIAAFQPGTRVELHVFLAQACVGVRCEDGERCEAGACVRECADRCEDAGPAPDAAAVDAPRSDAGPDAPEAACVLRDGLCGVPSLVAVGDRWTLRPCAAGGGDVTVHYTITPPVGAARDGSAVQVDQLGNYSVSAAASEPAGCTASFPFSAPTLVEASSEGRPGGWGADAREMAARLDMAFVATGQGPFAATVADGWASLSSRAGVTIPNDLSGVAVSAGHPVFVANPSGTSAWRFEVASLTTVSVSGIVLPATGRAMRSLASPFTRDASDASPVLVGASTQGLVRMDVGASSTTRAIGEVWDSSWAAVSSDAAATGSTFWLSRPYQLRNLPEGSEPALAGGAAVSTAGLSELRTMELDASGDGTRLWLCAGGNGVFVFDLGRDPSALTELPAPSAHVTTRCSDLALDPTDASAWVATPMGLGRLDADGTWRVLGAPLPSNEQLRVALAWDDARRQLWTVSGDSTLLVLDVGR